MKNYILSSKYRNIHFVGAGGVSMSALMKHCIKLGKTVTGSDVCHNNYTDELIELGAKITFKHASSNIKRADAVVFSSAINEKNPELIAAKRKKIPIVKRSELLGEISERFLKTVAISGSHGKTTATAMIANVMKTANKEPTVFLGGESLEYGNYLSGEDDLCIIEACEYKKNFLDVIPDVSVVLNIDNDHMDAYKDMRDMVDTFRLFVGNSLAVINADDVNARNIFNSSTVTFGINTPATYTAKNIKPNGIGYSFTACAHGRAVGKINLSIAGRHNVYNALATFAVADVLRVPFCLIKQGLESYKGVKRRNEYLGKWKGLNFYADYAHHPRELSCTLQTFLEQGEDFVTVFQPHTYSRTINLMDSFVSVFKDIKPLVIYKTYSAREGFDEKGSAKTLCGYILGASGENCIYADTEEELIRVLDEYREKYKKVVFFGAGDIYDLAKSLMQKEKSE